MKVRSAFNILKMKNNIKCALNVAWVTFYNNFFTPKKSAGVSSLWMIGAYLPKTCHVSSLLMTVIILKDPPHCGKIYMRKSSSPSPV